jgi:hypothetical protein
MKEVRETVKKRGVDTSVGWKKNDMIRDCQAA